MNKLELIKKIMTLGVELDKTDDRVHITMVINDAEKMLDRFLVNLLNEKTLELKQSLRNMLALYMQSRRSIN